MWMRTANMSMSADWLTSDGLWLRVMRFALVGGGSTLAYGIFTLVIVEWAGKQPLLATLAGYLLVIPLNYALQRLFTFRSKEAMSRELPRFLIVHGLNIAASFLTMLVVVKVLHADYRWGVGTTMVLVPALVFLAMDKWVFRREQEHVS